MGILSRCYVKLGSECHTVKPCLLHYIPEYMVGFLRHYLETTVII
jgi:hypothetical protein